MDLAENHRGVKGAYVQATYSQASSRSHVRLYPSSAVHGSAAKL